MSQFGQFQLQIDAMQEALQFDPLDQAVTDLVVQIAGDAFTWPVSPVGAVNVLAGSLVSAAVGMAGAVGSGNLSIFEIADREDLRVAVVSLRQSADVFEALLKAGAA